MIKKTVQQLLVSEERLSVKILAFSIYLRTIRQTHQTKLVSRRGTHNVIVVSLIIFNQKLDWHTSDDKKGLSLEELDLSSSIPLGN